MKRKTAKPRPVNLGGGQRATIEGRFSKTSRDVALAHLSPTNGDEGVALYWQEVDRLIKWLRDFKAWAKPQEPAADD